MQIEYRDAVASDIPKFFDEPPGQTLRAVTVLLDGEPVGLIGVARFQDHMRYFSEVLSAGVPIMRKMTVLRAIKKSISMVESSALPVLAIAQNEQSPVLLTRLGFVPIDENNEVFAWHSWLPHSPT
jgi:hypothetical protein